MTRENIVLPAIGTGPLVQGSSGYQSSDSRPSSSSSNHWKSGAFSSSKGAVLTSESHSSRSSKRSSIHHGRHHHKLPRLSQANKVTKTRNVPGQGRLFQSLTPRGTRWRDPSGFVRYSSDEDCIKCMLRIPHKKCESHKYIRVGGGYRHSYWYVRALLEELEFQRQQELLRQQRLDAIQEKGVHAVKTYIRTKSGRLIEKIIFMSDEDYKAFRKAIEEGGDPEQYLKKYLTKEEADNLASYDKEEQVPIKTYIRTKSGRLIEKLVYVSKTDYDRMKRGEISAQDLLKSHLKDGETLEKWEEAKMRTITIKVRTKSGRIIEKVIQISEEDYQKMKKGGDMKSILSKYGQIGEGEQIEGWEEPKKTGMKVVKTYIRTKSGRLIEKTILMTEEEYKKFIESGGDLNYLKKFLKLEPGEEIADWEKGSTVYSASEDEDFKGKAGQRVVGKDGQVYEYVVDPITGKMYKRKVGGADTDSGIGSIRNGKKGGGGLGEIDEEQYRRMKAGKRQDGSDSDFSYRSFVSEGGTRHVKRRKKHADGHRSGSDSYHSSQDADGEARRRKRRRDRKHEGSAHSYYSVVSEGGTRHVKRKKKNADGTYGDSESYHSEDSLLLASKKKGKGKKGKGGKHGDDSDYSYSSDVSAGGTRRQTRKKKIRDKDGNVIGYGKAQDYSSDEEKGKKKKKKRREHGDDSDHSYYSEVSEGGTRTRKRRARIRDKDGNVIGHGKGEDYSSSDSEGGKKKKKRKPRVHGSDSEYSYYSEVSEGGTKHRARRKRIRDAQGRVIGHGDVEAYTSDSDSFISVSDGKGGRMKVRKQRGSVNKGHWKGETPVFSDATTDSDIVAAKLAKMTDVEKAAYLAEREKRKQDRDVKRREKYGEKYDEMMEQHERAKKVKEARKKYEKEKEEAQAKAKSMVKYGKGGRKSMVGDPDDREIGMAHDEWGKKDKKPLVKKVKDGHEADGEEDDGEYGEGRAKKKGGRKGSGLSSMSGESVWSVDEHGNKIKKKIRIKDGKRYEYVYDKDGNLIKKTEKPLESDDGDYFEVDPVTGELRLKAGKKKLDLSKLTDDQLRALGIDPNLSKSEIKRLLMEKFGDQLEIIDRGKKIGMKTLADYKSDVGTDELADDSDFDVSTLRGMKRVNVKMRRGGQNLIDHLKRIMEDSKLKDDYARDLDERDGDIDFLAHYRLVDPSKLEMYGRAFVVEDEDFDAVLKYKEMKIGLEGVPTVNHLTKKQMEYVMKVLKLDDAKQITFKMFAVVSSMCERVTQMDNYCKHLIEISNLLDIERKIDLYKSVFYCNASSDRDPNFITSESLLIELIAGGLNRKQQDYIMGKMTPNHFAEISFLDYMCYIPLFLSMHDNICYNPLDMSDQKYANITASKRHSIQRDMNPLGSHLKKTTPFLMRKQAHDLLEGKIETEVTDENRKILEKYSRLPTFVGVEAQEAQTSQGQAEDMGVNIFLDRNDNDDDDA